MIDTHCHLTDPRLAAQLPEVMARAAAAGVSRMVTIGTTPPDWERCLAVCRKYPNVRCALGVHPNHCDEVDLADVQRLGTLLSSPGVVAMGEMGLDYHHKTVPREIQHRFFEAQLEIGKSLGQPLVIHSRLAVFDCLAMLKQKRIPSAVFHCFTGTPEEAGAVAEAGYLIGFTGVATFKNAPQLREIAARLPAEQILVETDAPYLSPEPFRGQKVNESALVTHTAQAIAAARGMNLEEFDRLTTDNALRFYRWGGSALN